MWDFFQASYKEFRKRLKKVHKSGRKGDIHKLRVALKKIKTIILIVRDEDHIIGRKERKKLENIFKLAGAIREAQVNLDLIVNEKNDLLNSYRAYLTKKIRLDNKKIKNYITSHRHSIQISKSSRKHIYERIQSFIKKRQLQCFEKATTARIRCYLKYNDQRILHEIRKEIKHLIFISKFHTFQHPSAELDEALGSWHDQAVLIYSLESFGFKEPRLYGYIERIKYDNSQQAAKLRKAIASTLDCNIHCH